MVLTQLTDYLYGARTQPLPGDVVTAATHHVLDTLAAVVSGTTLPAGLAATRHVRRRPAPAEATAVGAHARTSVELAALANAMAAHADETDDSHEPSRTHPGCSIVPTALAVAESRECSGAEFLRAVTAGYDLAGRMTPAMWPDFASLRAQPHSTHAIGALFGSAAAASVLAGLDRAALAHMLAYTAQHISGTTTWLRDEEHIEKAFVFAGMGAANAVRSLELVESGWPGLRDVFAGQDNILTIFGDGPEPSRLLEGLGTSFVITETNLKRFSVGSPAQAPLQGLIDLMHDEGIDTGAVTRVSVTMPRSLAHVVLDRDIPAISLTYLLRVALEDGQVTFAAAHDQDRFEKDRHAPDARIEVHADDQMRPVRQAIVEVTLTDGTTHRRHETAISGSPTNPLRRDQVVTKALDLCSPVLGAAGADRLVGAVFALPEATSVDDLLAAPAMDGPG